MSDHENKPAPEPVVAWASSVENIVVSRNGENRVHVRTTVAAMTDGSVRASAEVVE